MGRKPLSQEQIQATRQHLFDISNKMIQENGLDSLNIRELCREAGISYSSFYQYYESKDALISAKISALDDFLEASRRERLTHADNIRNLAEYICIYADFCGHRRHQIVCEMYRVQLASRIGQEQKEKRPAHQILLEIAEDGQSKGQIRKDFSAEEIVRMVLAQCKGLTIEWCLHEGEFDLPAFASRVAPLWAETLRAPA